MSLSTRLVSGMLHPAVAARLECQVDCTAPDGLSCRLIAKRARRLSFGTIRD